MGREGLETFREPPGARRPAPTRRLAPAPHTSREASQAAKEASQAAREAPRPLERPQGRLRGLKGGFQASRPDDRLPGLFWAARMAGKRSGKHRIGAEQGRQATVWADTLRIRCCGLPNGCGCLRSPKTAKNHCFLRFSGFWGVGGDPPANFPGFWCENVANYNELCM